MSKSSVPFEERKLAAHTIRLLAADCVQKANSGHPGMPMGMADAAFVLWHQFLKFNPQDPQWPGRDRFVLSAGHGSALLYVMLHLYGYDISLSDLKAFRQLGSKTPGHPEFARTPGVETTSGPLGIGFAAGIGMAIAAEMSAARYNRDKFRIFGRHRIYGIVSDGDLMEGISNESASLAGHLGLGNIIYLYDSNQITIEGKTGLAFSENVGKRFQALGWDVRQADGHNQDAVAQALAEGIQATEQPSLIITKTHIGYGSPNKQDTAGVHGAPLGETELAETKQRLGWSHEAWFYVPPEVRKICEKRVVELQEEYQAWQAEYAQWQTQFPELDDARSDSLNAWLPDDLEDQLYKVVPKDKNATRVMSGAVMQKIADLIPGFCGGSADLAPSNKSELKAYASIQRDNFKGRNLHFGIREQAMAGILNGIALYEGFRPYGATFLVFSDFMKPAMRLCAMMGLPVIYIFSHDSFYVGEDGPTHQPVEQLSGLRIIPNMMVIRPADSMEVAAAWALALRNVKGPTALILTRQKLAPLSNINERDMHQVQKGGYILAKEHQDPPQVTLIASGSEVSLVMEATELLKEAGYSVRVVSMPSLESFKRQPTAYKYSVIPQRDCPLVIVEAATSVGWEEISQGPMKVIDIKQFGISAPFEDAAQALGFTPRKIAQKVKHFLDLTTAYSEQ